MSDKTNNLNENSENIQFDEQIQDYSSEPNKQGTVNKATAPLPELPDREDGHAAETMKSESSATEIESSESSVSPEEAVKAIAPLPELPDTEDGHVAETMKSESSATEIESSESSVSSEDNNKADDVKPVEPVKPIQVIKPLTPKHTDESAKPHPLVPLTN